MRDWARARAQISFFGFVFMFYHHHVPPNELPLCSTERSFHTVPVEENGKYRLIKYCTRFAHLGNRHDDKTGTVPNEKVAEVSKTNSWAGSLEGISHVSNFGIIACNMGAN